MDRRSGVAGTTLTTHLIEQANPYPEGARAGRDRGDLSFLEGRVFLAFRDNREKRMTDLNHLIEQHIREHDARRKHIEELAQKARERVGESAEHKAAREQLAELMAERDKLIVRVDEFKFKSLDQWREEEIERAGLMGIWDALAQKLEELVERLER
jgi:uncharacterized coiled-coil DUF342 family protein